MSKNWAIFISGVGSNLGALLDVKGSENIRLVVSSTDKAFGLLKAKRAGVPTLVLEKPINWTGLLEQLEKFQINHIFLAGFMKIVPESFISQFKGKIVNLHPSLLPLYPGLHSIEKSFNDKQPMGITVHNVIADVDAGESLIQRRVGPTENLNESEFLIHVSEQRLVREVISKC